MAKTITLTGTPANPQDAATKGYVDTQIAIYDGTMTAVDHGALAWTSDPQITTNMTPIIGSVYATVFRAAASGTCGKMVMQCVTLQTTPTDIRVGLFDLSGNLLATSANVNVSFQTTGTKTIALGNTVALVAGAKYVAALLVVGGTAPTVTATVGSSQPALNQTLSNTTPLRQMKTSVATRTAFTNPEVWTGYAVVGQAPLALMVV